MEEATILYYFTLFYFPIFPQSTGSTFFKLAKKTTSILFYFPIFPQSPFRKIVIRPYNSLWAKSLSNNGRTEGYIYTVLYVLYYKYILVAVTGCFVIYTVQYTVLLGGPSPALPIIRIKYTNIYKKQRKSWFLALV